MKRRDFISSIIRTSFVAGIFSVAGYLVFRPKDESCPYDFTCRYCGKFDNCNLSKAKETKSEIIASRGVTDNG